MSKKLRIGSDPLGWIKDTKEPGPEASTDGPVETATSPGPRSKPVNPGNLGKLGKQHGKGETVTAGLPAGWTRATFILREAQFETLKALAYLDRRQLKELLDEILASYLTSRGSEIDEAAKLYARKHGKAQ